MSTSETTLGSDSICRMSITINLVITRSVLPLTSQQFHKILAVLPWPEVLAQFEQKQVGEFFCTGRSGSVF